MVQSKSKKQNKKLARNYVQLIMFHSLLGFICTFPSFTAKLLIYVVWYMFVTGFVKRGLVYVFINIWKYKFETFNSIAQE